jgi:CheY-like chemotaxis protein
MSSTLGAYALTTPPPAVPPRPPGSIGTILVVDDEDAVREITRRILARAGYQILEAASPAQALALCERPDLRLGAVLTDASMPGMSGPHLIETLRVARPGLPALLMSGYSAASLPGGKSLPPDVPLMHKPFTGSVLLRQLQDLLGW